MVISLNNNYNQDLVDNNNHNKNTSKLSSLSSPSSKSLTINNNNNNDQVITTQYNSNDNNNSLNNTTNNINLNNNETLDYSIIDIENVNINENPLVITSSPLTTTTLNKTVSKMTIQSIAIEPNKTISPMLTPNSSIDHQFESGKYKETKETLKNDEDDDNLSDNDDLIKLAHNKMLNQNNSKSQASLTSQYTYIE